MKHWQWIHLLDLPHCGFCGSPTTHKTRWTCKECWDKLYMKPLTLHDDLCPSCESCTRAMRAWTGAE